MQESQGLSAWYWTVGTQHSHSKAWHQQEGTGLTRRALPNGSFAWFSAQMQGKSPWAQQEKADISYMLSEVATDTHSASTRHPQAQSYFTTQMSTRKDRWNNPTKPDCASTESKRCQGTGILCSHLRCFPLECVTCRGKKKSKKQNRIYWHGHRSEVLLLVGRLNQTYRLQ